MPDDFTADPIPHEKVTMAEPMTHETIRRPLADEKGLEPVEVNEAVVERRRFSPGGLIAGAVVVVLVVLGVVWLISGWGG